LQHGLQAEVVERGTLRLLQVFRSTCAKAMMALPLKVIWEASSIAPINVENRLKGSRYGILQD
jgi:hypothetical protein